MPGQSRPFIAAFDSDCAGCGGQIMGEEDEIVMYDGEAYHADDDCIPEQTVNNFFG